MTTAFEELQRHAARVQQAAATLPRPALLAFCVGCIDRHVERRPDTAWDGLTAGERERLEDAIDALHDPLGAHEAQRLLDALHTREDIDPDGIDLRIAVELALRLCISGELEAVVGVSERVLESLEHADDDDALMEELDAQLAALNER